MWSLSYTTKYTCSISLCIMQVQQCCTLNSVFILTIEDHNDYKHALLAVATQLCELELIVRLHVYEPAAIGIWVKFSMQKN